MTSCLTPGCETVPPSDEHERAYCERCGWPLAVGRVSVLPEQLQFHGRQSARLKVTVTNQGLGLLGATLDGVEIPVDPLEVPAGQNAAWEVEVPPTDAPHTALEVRLRDRKGEHRNDFRAALPDCWRVHRLLVPTRLVSYGPLEVAQTALVFLGKGRVGTITIRNAGGSRMTVSVLASQGYQVSMAGTMRQSEFDLELGAGAAERLEVRRSESQQSDGTLTVSPLNLPQLEIPLRYLAQRSAPPPSETVLAIDFGTSKSAMMVFRQGTRKAVPQSVTWDVPGKASEPEWYVPSRVVWEGGAPTRFGFEVDPEETTAGDKRVFTGMKMLLRQTQDPQLRSCVVFYLKKLLVRALDHLALRSLEPLVLAITLPVLDNDGPEAQRQQELTLQCLMEAGAPYGLRSEQVRFFKEPECAAIDFLDHLQQGNVAVELQPDDWLCILDMGGGTTDITLARLSVEDGRPSFSAFHSLGYDGMAGNRVNQELLAWCISQWQSRDRLMGAPADDPVALKGEKTRISRRKAARHLGTLKELIYATDPPVERAWSDFDLRANELVLEPDKLRPRLVDLARQMFELGVADRFPSLKARLESLEAEGTAVRALDIKLLCLTGGTCNIPVFREQLLASVLSAKTTQVLADPGQKIRQNVVRGAALRPSYRFGTQLTLPFSVRLFSPSETREERIGSSSLPGREVRARVWAAEREPLELSVITELPGEGPLVLYRQSFANASDDGCHAEAALRYSPSGSIEVKLEWDTADELERSLLPWTTVWSQT